MGRGGDQSGIEATTRATVTVTSGKDTDHFLQVDADGNWQVVHPGGCPTEEVSSFLDDNPNTYSEFRCRVAWEVSYWGLDFLTDQNGRDIAPSKLPAGDYQLILDWYSPTSMFEEPESNLYVVIPDAA